MDKNKLLNEMFVSLQNGNLVNIKNIINNGFDINTEFTLKDGRKAIPLIYVIGIQSTINEQNRFEIIKYLLEKGANTNYEDNQGYTPLIVAAFNSNSNIVKLLLEYKAKYFSNRFPYQHIIKELNRLGKTENAKLIKEFDDKWIMNPLKNTLKDKGYNLK